MLKASICPARSQPLLDGISASRRINDIIVRDSLCVEHRIDAQKHITLDAADARALLRLRPRVPIYALSASCDAEEQERCRAAGMVRRGHLKPSQAPLPQASIADPDDRPASLRRGAFQQMGFFAKPVKIEMLDLFQLIADDRRSAGGPHALKARSEQLRYFNPFQNTAARQQS